MCVYLLLCLGLPIPIVVISVGLSFENYAIKDNSGNRIIAYVFMVYTIATYVHACEVLKM